MMYRDVIMEGGQKKACDVKRCIEMLLWMVVKRRPVM